MEKRSIRITYQGVQRDEGKGEEVDVEIGNVEVRIENSPSHRDILIIDDDRTIVVKLDKNYKISELFEEKDDD